VCVCAYARECVCMCVRRKETGETLRMETQRAAQQWDTTVRGAGGAEALVAKNGKAIVTETKLRRWQPSEHEHRTAGDTIPLYTTLNFNAPLALISKDS
jgi:hypothetical protein